MFNRRGQSLVEFAMILPLLVILLMGIIDFGRVFNAYIVLSNLSREGARYAAVGEDDLQIQEYITQQYDIPGAANLQVLIDPSKSNRGRGEPVSVRLEVDISLYTPLLSSILPNPIHLTSKTIMRVE